MRTMSKCSLGYRLRESIDIQSPTTPADGETTPTYANVATGVRAEVLPVRGTEQTRGRQVEATVTWVVTIRYRTGIQPDYRIVWGSQTLNIVSAYDPDQRGRELVCECKEVQP